LAKLDIYLLATYVARPKNPRQTSRAGYITDPNNIQYDENLSIVRGWRDRYLKYSVVLDLTNERVIRIVLHLVRHLKNYLHTITKDLVST
jgi:hypothetical protein